MTIETIYYDSGQLKYKGVSDENLITIKETFWYEDGQKELEIYTDSSGVYHNGWYEDGQVRFKRLNDPLIGVLENNNNKKFYVYEWYKNGQKKLEFSTDKNRVSWYENGQKKEEWFKDDDINKTFTVTKWFEDGVLKSVMKETKNKGDYIHEEYHPNGKIKSKTYKRPIPSTRIDSWREFDTCKDCWDINGNLTNCHPNNVGIQDVGNDIMDGLTDDERELGRDFWKRIY